MGAAIELLSDDHKPLLSHGMDVVVTARNSAPGTIVISYPLGGIRADHLGAGQLVRVRASASGRKAKEIAPYILQDFEIDWVESPNGERTQIGKWSGVQHGWHEMLGSLTHDNYFPGGIEPFARWAGNPGRIMWIIAYYARARSAFTRLGVSIQVNSPTDSGDLPWIADYDQSIDLPWNEDATEPLKLMFEDSALEWDLSATPTFDDPEDPDGTEELSADFWSYLRLYNPGNMGTDRTSVGPGGIPMEIKPGTGVESMPMRESLGLGPLQRVLAFNRHGDSVIVETDDIGDHVREIGLPLPDVESLEVLERRATRFLNASRKRFTEQAVELDLSGETDLPVPGRDLGVGDYLYLDTHGESKRRRVAEWSLHLQDDGRIKGGIVFDEVIRTFSQRFSRGLSEAERQIVLTYSGVYD